MAESIKKTEPTRETESTELAELLEKAGDGTVPGAQLVITKYLDREPQEVQTRLDGAIRTALDAAAERIHAHTRFPRAEPSKDGAVVRGLAILDGTEVNCEGAARLTTVRVTVPWRSGDGASGQKWLAANRFAHVLCAEASAA